MSSLIKTRVRRGPKAKSIAVLPRSLIALNLPQVSAPTEWIDEDIEEVQRKKKKLRKSFTREFKLCAITIVYGSRINAKGCEVPAVVTVFSHFFFFLMSSIVYEIESLLFLQLSQIPILYFVVELLSTSFLRVAHLY